MFGGIVSWLNSWSDGVKTLVPAIGTLAIIIIGIVVMVAGSNWSAMAKKLLVGVMAGIAIASYGPAIVTQMAG